MKELISIVILLMACCLGCVCGICVLDNKKGWSLECGVRDSYLFRVKDYGGVRANFDFGFEFGNEKGFPLSITNSKKGKGGGYGYHRRQDNTARSSDVAHESGNSWPLPQDLRPPPAHSLQDVPESVASVYQVPAQRRQVVGPFSREKMPVGQSSLERGNPVGQKAAENGLVQPTTIKGDSGTLSSVERRPVVRTSLERPVYQSSFERPIPIVRNPADRRASSEMATSRQRPVSPPQRARNRNRNSRRPSRAQSFLSWLPWPFSYFVSSPDPTTASPIPAPVSPNKRAHTNFRVFHEGDLQQGFGPPQQGFSPPQQGFGAPQQGFSPPQQGFGAPQQGFNVPQLSPPLAAPPSFHNPQPQPQPHHQQIPHHLRTTTRPPPTVGPEIAQVLRVHSDTPADTDHVPSFAARMFVVREAPKDYHPPGYTPSPGELTGQRVEVPRTKFFCEEQKYLPGIYADMQLGCKVFHLCVPAAMGNTLTSFMCPNMTLFDQSILQCNWWFHVSCEESNSNYDANLPLAISYRKINSALLPLSEVSNLNSVSLLAHNTNGFVSRISRAMDFSEEETNIESDAGEGEVDEFRSETNHLTDSPLTFFEIDFSPDQNVMLKRFFKLLEVAQSD